MSTHGTRHTEGTGPACEAWRCRVWVTERARLALNRLRTTDCFFVGRGEFSWKVRVTALSPLIQQVRGFPTHRVEGYQQATKFSTAAHIL